MFKLILGLVISAAAGAAVTTGVRLPADWWERRPIGMGTEANALTLYLPPPGRS